MTDRISIVVTDDHPLFREGVVTSLMDSGVFDVVAQAGNKDDALVEIERHMPHLALVDVSMPGGGIETAAAINAKFPIVKIIMLTVSEREDDVQAALRAHASGYVLKGVDSKELVRILQNVYNGETYITPTLAGTLLINNANNKNPEFDLSDREKQILEKLAVGMSNKEIAKIIHLSEKTVKHYMTNIMNKLQVSNRVQAAIKAYEMAQKRDK